MRKQHLKVASLLVALTFQGVALTDAVGLHGCPVHDVLPGGIMVTGDHALAAPAATHQVSGHHPGAPQHESHGGPCTCVGSCQNSAGGSPALTVQPLSLALAPPAVRVAASVAPRLELPGSPAFLLPYSHGPPLSA